MTTTLHEGKGKAFNKPECYRAISLLPVVFKVFGKLVLQRIMNFDVSLKVNQLQHGFQKDKDCKTISFVLQEARNFGCERGSSLLTYFLDAQSVFDCVWLDGLIYKLYGLGIKGKPLRILNQMSKGSSTNVS